MILATANKRQRNTEHRGGETLLRRCSAPYSSAAHDKAQSGAHTRPVSVQRCMIAGRCTSSRVRTCGSLNRSRLFPIRIAACSCMGITRRADTLAPSQRCRPDLIAIHSGLRRRNVAPNRRSVAKFLRRCIRGSRTHSLDALDHLPCRDTDLLHRHSSRLPSAGHEQTIRARGFVNVRNSIGEIRNV